ncbi:MAG: DUF3343 domain-containing protein [Bullifex sp.]
MNYIITFYSHYEAMQARRIAKGGRLISVPRALSSSCGTAMELEEKEDYVPSFRFEALYRHDGERYSKVTDG